MNEYDSNRILDFTKKINYFPTSEKSEADCYIINTCHIREKATEKVFHDIGRVKKEFRNKKTNFNNNRLCCTGRRRLNFKKRSLCRCSYRPTVLSIYKQNY